MCALEFGSNVAYKNYCQNEETMNLELSKISPLTENYIKRINYENIRYKRKRNFNYLGEKLTGLNQWDVDLDSMIPYVYPFYIEINGIREKMVEKRYISIWWKCVMSSESTNSFEKKLANYLIPRPIDKQYDTLDMEYMVNILLPIIGK